MCASRQALLPLVAAAALGATAALAGTPEICAADGGWQEGSPRGPPAVSEYLGSLGQAQFDLRAACARWAGTYSRRQEEDPAQVSAASLPAARLILFPSSSLNLRQLAVWLSRSPQVQSIERASHFVVAEFARNASTRELREILDAPQVEYFEPDCDGPDFLTTSQAVAADPRTGNECWRRDARDTFPNDPCMEELWGHAKIGWDSSIAAHSLPRLIAVLDSGIDAQHADLARSVVLNVELDEPANSLASRLNSQCATSGRCYPHGTQMAGTIAGRMNNGVGIAGVAPNSRLVPIVISQVDRGLLARLSTIAEGIDAATAANVDVINISAKWPVDSRAISQAVQRAVAGSSLGKRLLVTGYTSTLQYDETLREYYPSRYRCLSGVIAAVPTDMRGRDLFNPKGHPDVSDGRIQAPGVDIVVATIENSAESYALSEAAGPSTAAAYVSGAIALIWGSPPLDQCGAQEIKQLLFCRSKSSASSRYPWINVDFLGELSKVEAGANCHAALEALGCL